MDERAIAQMLVGERTKALREYPFFGRLLLHLRFGLSDCGTAFTDMRRIVFDPQFAARLSPQEIGYVLMHEVLHCALKHCLRARGKEPLLYNVACDIVVNSTMLEMYNQSEIVVDGEPLMHLAPNGHEGREYAAEEIYEMLMQMTPAQFACMYGFDMHSGDSAADARGGGSGTDDAAAPKRCGTLDVHDGWRELDGTELEDVWDQRLKEASRACGVGSGIPQYMARYLKEVDRSPRTNWRQILHDFIRFDRSDYDFTCPDRRYTGEVILPSFCDDMDGAKVEKVWFLVDTSGSVSDEAVSVAYAEIQQATVQIENISGILSFFDGEVSEPVPFESLEDILSVKPIGGGGTSFYAIFETLAGLVESGEAPKLIIILTDGYAPFPEEEAALGIPVIWIIVDSEIEPPWGTHTFIST